MKYIPGNQKEECGIYEHVTPDYSGITLLIYSDSLNPIWGILELNCTSLVDSLGGLARCNLYCSAADHSGVDCDVADLHHVNCSSRQRRSQLWGKWIRYLLVTIVKNSPSFDIFKTLLKNQIRGVRVVQNCFPTCFLHVQKSLLNTVLICFYFLFCISVS